MRSLILFKGAVETQEFFSYQLSEPLKKMGYEIFWYDLSEPRSSYEFLCEFLKNRKSSNITVFTFNHNGIAGEDYLYEENGNNFWDEHNIFVLNMVVDHPLYYHKYMKFVPNRYNQISIDRNHEKYLKRYFPDIHSGGFLPLGGTELNRDRFVYQEAEYLPLSERNIDVIFTGNYTKEDTFLKFIKHMDNDYQEFYLSLLEETINNPQTLIEELAERRLKEEIGELRDEDLKSCMTNMMFVDLSVRFHYRAEAVRILADNGIKVHTYGAGWDVLPCRHPENIIQGGSVDSLKCLEMISQSKISLNVMPWFKDGAHDRIFNTMLNGALSLTDKSTYLSQQFIEGEDLLFYNLEEMKVLPQIVADALKDESRLEENIRSGYLKAKNKHTWECRAVEIARILNQSYEI